MADLRSLTNLLETNLKQGKGTVGWGKLQTGVFKSIKLMLPSVVLPIGCG
jgi:hypothetical protein